MMRLRLLMVWALCIGASAYAGVRMLYLIARNPRKAWTMAVSHDQLANAAINGDMDETISSRANRARTNGRWWGCILCHLLDRIDKDHCTRSAGT